MLLPPFLQALQYNLRFSLHSCLYSNAVVVIFKKATVSAVSSRRLSRCCGFISSLPVPLSKILSLLPTAVQVFDWHCDGKNSINEGSVLTRPFSCWPALYFSIIFIGRSNETICRALHTGNGGGHCGCTATWRRRSGEGDGADWSVCCTWYVYYSAAPLGFTEFYSVFQHMACSALICVHSHCSHQHRFQLLFCKKKKL